MLLRGALLGGQAPSICRSQSEYVDLQEAEHMKLERWSRLTSRVRSLAVLTQ